MNKAYLDNYMGASKNDELNDTQPDINQIIQLSDRRHHNEEKGELASNRLDFDEVNSPGVKRKNDDSASPEGEANDLLEMSLNNSNFKIDQIIDNMHVQDLETSYMEYKN